MFLFHSLSPPPTPLDAYRPPHWLSAGWGCRGEDAPLLPFWEQCHTSQQVWVVQPTWKDQHQPYDSQVRPTLKARTTLRRTHRMQLWAKSKGQHKGLLNRKLKLLEVHCVLSDVKSFSRMVLESRFICVPLVTDCWGIAQSLSSFPGADRSFRPTSQRRSLVFVTFWRPPSKLPN